MPEATGPADAAAKPASQATTPKAADAPPAAAGAQELRKQPPPQQGAPAEGQPAPEKTPEQKDAERRADALARAKRESARTQREREQLERERATHAEDLKLAAEHRRLQKLIADDPLKFAKEVGLSIPELSKRFVAGDKKSPAELVKEEVDRRLTEEAKAREEADKKAQAEASAARERQLIDGAKRDMAALVKANPERFELVGGAGQRAIDDAWKLVEDYFAETQKQTGAGQVLDFSKALDAIEAREEKFLAGRLGGKKVTALVEKLRAEAAEKQKQAEELQRKQKREEKQKASLSTGRSSSAGTERVVETETKSPTPSNRKARELSPTQKVNMARDLWSQHQAKQDN